MSTMQKGGTDEVIKPTKSILAQTTIYLPSHPTDPVKVTVLPDLLSSWQSGSDRLSEKRTTLQYLTTLTFPPHLRILFVKQKTIIGMLFLSTINLFLRITSTKYFSLTFLLIRIFTLGYLTSPGECDHVQCRLLVSDGIQNFRLHSLFSFTLPQTCQL